MTVQYRERASDSPFVQTIWSTEAVCDGCDMVAADSSWDILVWKEAGKTRLMLSGSMTRAKPIHHMEGNECLGIRFKPGTYIPYFPGETILDLTTILPEGTRKSFWLGSSTWEIPDFENADTFVNRLAKADLLVRDPIVDSVLHGEIRPVSLRSVQRRFLRITGLTHNTIWQIERARQAAALLEQGTPILEVVRQAGYADQQHMTRSLKRFFGQTPTQLFRMKSE